MARAQPKSNVGTRYPRSTQKQPEGYPRGAASCSSLLLGLGLASRRWWLGTAGRAEARHETGRRRRPREEADGKRRKEEAQDPVRVRTRQVLDTLPVFPTANSSCTGLRSARFWAAHGWDLVRRTKYSCLRGLGRGERNILAFVFSVDSQ